MPNYSHTPAEIATLEVATGLALLCWLDPGDGGPLLPVLARPELVAQRRARALQLNGRAAAGDAEGPRSRARAAG
jgi:hypothetical protein